MTLEDKYKSQMIALGTWRDAFEPTLRDMCMLEREIRRVRKAWKATAEEGEAPSPLDDHYTLIRTLSKELQGYRESLGLTPRGLRKLTAGFTVDQEKPAAEITVLDKVRKRRAV